MRYFFRLTDGTDELNPHQGIELLGNAAARDEAVRFATRRQAAGAPPGRGWDGWFVRFSITTARRSTPCRSMSCRT